MDFKTKKVELFGTIYTIEFVDHIDTESDDRFLCGQIDHDTRIIQVSKNDSEGKQLPESELKINLLHELVHMILAVGQYNVQCSDEPLVEFIARGFNQILKQKIL